MRSILPLPLLVLLLGCGGDEPAGAGGATTHSGTGGGAPEGGGPVGCPTGLPAPKLVDIDTPSLAIGGDPKEGAELGIFDPSVSVVVGDVAYMSYTAVDSTRRELYTRVARSDDGGASWTFVAAANTPDDGVIVDAPADPACGGGCPEATRIHEVSSLVDDATDPDPARRFKLFTHSYLTFPPVSAGAGPDLRYVYGTIRVATATEPDKGFSPPAPLLGWPSAVLAESTAPLMTTQIAGLGDCLALTEPAARVDPASGALLLAVGCIRLAEGMPTIAIELLRSLDHGGTFEHAHTLLSPADATCLGAAERQVNAAHLFGDADHEWLVATVDGPAALPGGGTFDGYRGCVVLERGAEGVVRDWTGAPIAAWRVDAPGGRFNGACADAPAGGLWVSTLRADEPPVFRIYGPVMP